MKLFEKAIDQALEFRKVTGLPVGSGDPDLKTHKAVILEELQEAADGLTDSIVTISGLYVDDVGNLKAEMAIAMLLDAMIDAGFNVEACMDKVQAANMSKVCTKDNVEATERKYSLLGVETFRRDLEGGYIGVFCAKTVTAKDGKFYPENKLLKSVDWFEPDWSDYEEWLTGDMLDLMQSID